MLYLILFLILLFTIAVLWFVKLYSLHRQITKLVCGAILRKISNKTCEIYFSSYSISQTIKFLLSFPSKKSKSAIFFLCYGRTDEAKQFLASHGRTYLAASLTGLYNAGLAQEMFSSIRNSEDAKAEIAFLAAVQQKKDKAQTILNGVKFNKLSAAAKAGALYFRAVFALNAGDLRSASEDCSASISLFQKKKCFYEEARAYLLLGEIYRISAASDTAEFMYKTALALAEKNRFSALKADIYGSLGMLYTGEERFAEAADSFSLALDQNRKLMRDEASANLYNQLALLTYYKRKRSFF